MKQLMATVYTILACAFCCNGQKHYIGTDIISGLCFETIQFRLSHGFTSHWSAGADIGINLASVIMTDNKLSQAHDDALKDSDLSIEAAHKNGWQFRAICIHMEYWPKSLYVGPLISLGGQIRDRGIPDITLGVGYSFRIVKGLGIYTMYRCGIREVYVTEKLPSDGIKAGIYYAF